MAKMMAPMEELWVPHLVGLWASLTEPMMALPLELMWEMLLAQWSWDHESAHMKTP
jgi:hypothetical protein